MVPCEKLTLKSLTPIRNSFFIASSLEVEGPTVQIILVFILVFMLVEGFLKLFLLNF